MSKGSAIIAILIAFVGGLTIGHLTGGGLSGEDGGSEIATVRLGAEGGSDDRPAAARGGAAPSGDSDIVRYRVPVTDDQPSKGPAEALVTIVEFSEFQCPFCARVGPTVSRIMNEYRGKVRFVWRNNVLPFHQNAGPAAQVAMEAFAQGGNDKFWQVHDVLFENQRSLERADLERYAQEAGLDMTRVRAALDNNTHQRLIDADMQLAGSLGARGTPGFFINGRQIMGAQPFERFKEIIDDEIRRAEAMIASGTPRNQLYASIIRDGRTSPAPAAGAGAAQKKAADRPARRQPDPAAVYRVPLTGNEPAKGASSPLVTIVEVSDFECPFCSRVGPTIAQILEEYPEDVRVVWFNNPLPFHRNAPLAHQAALEAMDQGGSAKFWQMHDVLFANQRELTRDKLEEYAQQVGLNMAQFRAALDNNEHQAIVDANQATARGLGATGTPSFFINGRNVRGAQPFEAFKRVIDEEIARARELIRNGTPRAGVYAAAIADGATEPQYLDGGDEPAAPDRPAAPDADRVYEIAVPANAPSVGPANAPVVIQEFSDFECPFCSRVNPTIQQIKERYGNQVRLVWRNYPLPFHQNAHVAAQAALEVFRQGGNEKFFAYHDILFQNQRALARADLERYAEQVGGINMAEFRQALDSERHKAAVDADMAAVTAAGARIGTPSFFINGRLLQGAQPFPAFQAAIDRALEER